MKYWVYLNGEVPGNYTPEEIAAIPGIGDTTMVCPADGGIAERNWLRAGQFPEIVEALRKTASAPIAPEAPMPTHNIEPGRPLDPNDILNDSSSRLFRHVTDLMKELENRRGERAMSQSLQRQLVELKNELLALRERNQYLQERADLIPGFQEREENLQKNLDTTRQHLQEREAALRNTESDLGKVKDDLEGAKRAQASSEGDIKRQAETIEDLSKQLAQKEFTLAKAFGVIRRLEEVMGDLLPSAMDGISSEVPGYPPVEESQEEAPPPPPEPENAPEPTPKPESAPEPEIQVRTVEPEPDAGPTPDPAIQDLVSSSYTEDTGEAKKVIELPPEGEVTPVPPPWTKIVDKVKGFLSPESPEKGPDPVLPPAPPTPGEENDINKDQS